MHCCYSCKSFNVVSRWDEFKTMQFCTVHTGKAPALMEGKASFLLSVTLTCRCRKQVRAAGALAGFEEGGV